MWVPERSASGVEHRAAPAGPGRFLHWAGNVAEVQINSAVGIPVVLLLIGANAFFVASEFALVAVERARIESDAAAGNRVAGVVLGLLRRLLLHLSSAQLGITLTSLVLGFVAEPAIGDLIEPVIEPLLGGSARGVSIGLALALAVVTQLLFGEQLPKVIAISRPGGTARAIAAPMKLWSLAVGPFVRGLNGVANRIIRRIGIEPAEELSSGRSRGELEYLIRSSGEGGTLDRAEVALLTRAIRFREKTAADVLTPRVEIVAVGAEDHLSDVARLARETGHSRFPVIRADLDDVVGVIHAKALFAVAPADRPRVTVADSATDVLVVPETRDVESLLGEMRHTRNQLAVVVDEHGGTAGLVTVEDLVEEVVGDIADEHDEVGEMTVVREAGSVLLAGSLHPDEVWEACGFEMPEGDYETLAGFALDQLQRIPNEGEIFTLDGWRIEVVETEGLRIVSLRLTPSEGRLP